MSFLDQSHNMLGIDLQYLKRALAEQKKYWKERKELMEARKRRRADRCKLVENLSRRYHCYTGNHDADSTNVAVPNDHIYGEVGIEKHQTMSTEKKKTAACPVCGINFTHVWRHVKRKHDWSEERVKKYRTKSKRPSNPLR